MAPIPVTPSNKTQPRMLLVDDEPVLHELFQDVIEGQVRGDVVHASTLSEAREILSSQEIDLLIADVNLPDGNGLSLLPEFHRLHPTAAALVITGAPSVEGAVTAMRCGAVDFVSKPFSADHLAQRIASALAARGARQRNDARMRKLRDAVKRLNQARKTVNRKVDLLCHDLVDAYSELSQQLDGVRIAEGYKQYVDRAGDLEQMLCHSMDWILRQLGYCNIGIWLSTADQALQLGAYMKYTIAADEELTGAMEKNLLNMVMRRGFLRLRQPELKSNLTQVEVKYLGSQEIIGLSCTYLGETLGVMALFRDAQTPFSDDDVAALKTIAPLFAVSLAQAVRRMEGPEEPEESAPSSDLEGPPTGGKKDPADWWKNGEESPF